jgi:rSAM/selenodomain-associated transferase 2/rSAM/selenodomain-associated transferase 1
MKDDRLCIFTRYPEPGKTKTRLIPTLGAGCAASLQYAMTAHILSAASRLISSRGVDCEVRYEGCDATSIRDTFGSQFSYSPQGYGDLGQRMLRCFQENLHKGIRSVVIAGADVPGIDEHILSKAFESLRHHDMIIGPAEDGGYYLIGLKTHVPGLFQDIPWGSADVLRNTLQAAEGLGLSVCTLPVLSDVDRPEDIAILDRIWGKARLKDAIGRVSVIIPALNENSSIENALTGLRKDDPSIEIIVVDGGSTDDTAGRAKNCGANVLVTKPGRAAQMNAGAEVATGGILLFLHSDTHLPDKYPELAQSALNRHCVVAGAFRFRLDAQGMAYRLLEQLVNWRSRVIQMPYGDQGLFMKAGIFNELGGFPDVPVMEDFEMVRRLKRRGRIFIAPASAVTSARRWKTRGFLKTTMLNQAMIAGYLLGVKPRTLSQIYRGRASQNERR